MSLWDEISQPKLRSRFQTEGQRKEVKNEKGSKRKKEVRQNCKLLRSIFWFPVVCRKQTDKSFFLSETRMIVQMNIHYY